MNAAAAMRPRPDKWAASLARARERIANASEIRVEGTLSRMVGMTLEAVGCEAAVGGRCLIDTAEGKQVEAEVVGFSGDKLFLMPTGDIRGIMPGARVIPTRSVSEVAVGDALLGRVLDGAGRPLDGLGELHCTDRVSLTGEPLNGQQRSKQQRHRNGQHHHRRELPNKCFDRSPQRRVRFGDGSADGDDLRRREDQRKCREPEKKRPEQFAEHVPVENREFERITADGLGQRRNPSPR